jgi:2-dehydro-3-deoxygluconokinase
MQQTCCFGELLIRYSPQLGGDWIHRQSMHTYVGGAELNVAHALARWALPVRYITAIPDHYLSTEIIQYLQDAGIDTKGILRNGHRIGAYYLPQGADLKHAGVIYDRAGSSFAALEPGMLDWQALLKQSNWFHFSAISPALNATAAAVCLEAVQQAKQLGLTVSVDLNYRSLLWKYGQSPATIMRQLIPYCDAVMGNIWSASSLLDIPLPEALIKAGTKQAFVAGAADSAAQIQALFPSVQVVANTFRFTGDSGVNYFASLHTQAGTTVSADYTTNQVIDKVGSGDCFMAALIRCIQLDKPAAYMINFAAAAAVGKLQELGDHTQQTVEAVEAKMMNHD